MSSHPKTKLWVVFVFAKIVFAKVKLLPLKQKWQEQYIANILCLRKKYTVSCELRMYSTVPSVYIDIHHRQ